MISAAGAQPPAQDKYNSQDESAGIAAFGFPLYFRRPMKTIRISRRKFLGAAGAAASLSFVPVPLRSVAASSESGPAAAHISTIRVSASAAPIVFDPDQALGSSMDILSHDVVEKIYTEPMVK